MDGHRTVAEISWQMEQSGKGGHMCEAIRQLALRGIIDLLVRPIAMGPDPSHSPYAGGVTVCSTKLIERIKLLNGNHHPPSIVGGDHGCLSIARSLGAAGIPVYAINHLQAEVRYSRFCQLDRSTGK